MNRFGGRSGGAGISLLASAAIGLLLGPAGAGADIYKYVDKYGRVTYTDKPLNARHTRLVKTWKGWVERKGAANNWRQLSENMKKFSPTIDYAATRYELPKTLLHAVITAESAYNPAAVSHAGAVGLMQLMPETARRYGVKNRLDPYENIHGGTRYLRDLLVMFNNDLVLALAAYNAGENAVKKYGNKVPPYSETRTYVNRVMQYYRRYQETMS